MRVNHLGLPVCDPRRSLRFYHAYFGFDPTSAQRYPDGTVIVRDADGFDLALHAVEAVEEPPPFLHFGFRLPDPDAVRALLRRLETDGVPIVESYDQPSYTAFKCLDPDGHRVEAYWEPSASG
ncbi:VOC family protein [Plantactinospora sp. WMMB334]|uniref:VOC family protein n=1 Tax=Plantactinospora sp. WMMB334 TaxID=3404119 RepID=UPI003B94B6D1